MMFVYSGDGYYQHCDQRNEILIFAKCDLFNVCNVSVFYWEFTLQQLFHLPYHSGFVICCICPKPAFL